MSRVVSVWGTCDETPVTFTQNALGLWETTVPADSDRVYILSLWAEDEAGNRGYFATIKVLFDTQQLCMKVTVLDVGAAFTMEDVRRVFAGTKLRTAAQMQEVRSAVTMRGIRSEITRCEVCGA